MFEIFLILYSTVHSGPTLPEALNTHASQHVRLCSRPFPLEGVVTENGILVFKPSNACLV